MKNKKLRYLLITVAIVGVGWTVLTIYVEIKGPFKEWTLGMTDEKKVLIIFDPDPFYNLDEQICLSFGKALAEKNMTIKIVTVAAADHVDQNNYDALIYCANTYNWRPDWSITSYIRNHPPKASQSIVAITIGAGSTESSQKFFENVIIEAGGKLVKSYSSWLWRPNDESRMKEGNVGVAVSLAHTWGNQFAEELSK